MEEAPSRHLLRRRDDPYAGADMALAKRLAAGLYLIGVACACIIFPLAPPTRAFGPGGWTAAAAVVVLCLLAAGAMVEIPERVGNDLLLAMSYSTLASIAILEWLAGGHDTPYHQLYILAVVYTCAVHPPRRVLVYLAAFLAAAGAPIAYGHASGSEIADIGLQVLICAGLGGLSCVMMDRIRSQRLSLQQEGDAERRLALTDALTGLGNRRGLLADLGERARSATREQPLMLALFDLDGFKAYNDTFGHPAGDALLTRLALSLDAAVGERGVAYRMGGDEFCVLADVEEASPPALAGRWRTALAEEGEGFAVTASAGWILLPAEAATPEEALRLADRSMYAAKSLGRASAGRQSEDVLLRALGERDEALPGHFGEVAALSEAMGVELGLPADELAVVRAAAALHDVGKVAVPDAILHKPGPLDADEWKLVRQHTLVGERIMNAAPSLAPAARLVRSSHERFDGSGYPDGLAGAEIPLGSRVVAVCDAFDAMVSDRSYRPAMSEAEALAELRACAGSQFDPDIVAAFARVLAKRRPLAA